MRVVPILLCFLLIPLLPAKLFGQDQANLFYENFQETPLPQVFNILRTKYAVKLAFDEKAIKDIVITQVIEGLSLRKTIGKILENTSLGYQIVDKDKVLIRKISQSRDQEDEGFEISGRIIDYRSGEGLSYATIISKDGTAGAIADEFGAFTIKVASPDEPLNVQYLGYESQQINGNGNAKDMVVKMSPKTHEIASVIIMEKLPVIRLNQEDGSTLFKASQLDQLPSFVGGKDIMRNLQLLPGIAAHDDLSAELRIRGGDGSENMVVLDGITLYNVDHYFGIFSAINPNFINEARLYKNNFPVEYGGRTSGIIELNSPPLTGQQVHGGVELNLLTSNAYLQLPLAKNMGIMLSGRITNTDVADTKLFNFLNQEQQQSPRRNDPNNNTSRNNLQALEPNFKFNDFNVKWEWQPTTKTKFAANFFRGFDNYDYNYELEYNRRLANFEVKTTETFGEDQTWNNLGGSLQIDHQWSKQLRSHINVTSSKYEVNNDIQSTNVDFRIDQNRIVRNRSINNQNSNEVKGWEFNWKNQLQLNPLNQLTFGYHFVDNDINFEFNDNRNGIFKGSNQGTQNSLFAQYDYSANKKFKASLGLRGTYYSITDQPYLSPRLFLSYQIDDNWMIKGSYNRYFQFLRESYHENRFGRTYEFWTLSDDDRFPVARANQFMVGLNFLDEIFELDVEFYRKATSGIVENALLISNIDSVRQADFKLFEGDRLTYGMDLLLKKTVGNYTSWLAYTLSKTTISFPDINNGTSFPSPDDRRHQLSWVNEYRWKNWDFSMTYVFSSGRPYTDVFTLIQLQRGKDRRTILPKDRLSFLEDYHRVDIGVNYNFRLGSTKAKVGASVFNLLNRKNVKYRQYNYSFSNAIQSSSAVGTELQLLDLTPNFSFSIEF